MKLPSAPQSRRTVSGDSLHSQPLTSTQLLATNSGIFLNPISEHILSLRNSVCPPTPTTTPQSISGMYPNLNSEPIYVATLISPYFGLGLVDALRDTSELDLEKYPMPVVIILFGTIVWLLLLLLLLPIVLFSIVVICI